MDVLRSAYAPCSSRRGAVGFRLRKHTAQRVSLQHCRLPAPRRACSAVLPAGRMRTSLRRHLSSSTCIQLSAARRNAQCFLVRQGGLHSAVLSRALSCDVHRLPHHWVHGTWCPSHPVHAPADAALQRRRFVRVLTHPHRPYVSTTILPTHTSPYNSPTLRAAATLDTQPSWACISHHRPCSQDFNGAHSHTRKCEAGRRHAF